MKKYVCFLALALLWLLNAISQDEKENSPRQIFLEAESYLLYEEYVDALPLYLKLSKANPENDNLNFKIGLCYLNIPYEKEKSIIYLEKAAKNISPNCKTESFKETKAPLDALYYLGNAYRINDQFDLALQQYQKFKKQLDPGVFDESLVTQQIRAIETAKRMKNRPVYFQKQNLGEPVNSRFSEFNAVVTYDESVLICNVKLQFYDALYYFTKTNGQWSDPVNIIPDLGVDGDVYATSISKNGKELFIYRSDKFDGNIYVSRFVNGKWSPIKKLNDNINTKYWESHASISADGKKLYFTSNRPGGFGDLDVYVATRENEATEDWINVTNLGPEINTKYNEDTPFPTEDGKTLYFSSYGHEGMGGYDIFFSRMQDNGKWSIPENVGYPINTSDDDQFFVPVQNGNFAYMCRFYPGGFGKTDVYRLELFSEDHPRKFKLRGIALLPVDAINNPDLQLTAIILDKKKKDTIQKITLNPADSKFFVTIPTGNYQLIYQGKGLQKSVENLILQKDQENSDIILSTQLESERKGESKTEPVATVNVTPEIGSIPFDKTFYNITDGKQVTINMNLPKGTELTVTAFNEDSVLIKTEKVTVNRSHFRYKYNPIPGKNILYFKAVAPDGSVSEGRVVVLSSGQEIKSDKNSIELANDSALKTNALKNALTDLSTGQLKSVLENLNLEKENIKSEKDLISYLKNQAEKNKLSPALIDSLVNSYQSNSALKLFSALKDLTHGDLRKIMDSVDLNTNLFKSPLEVIDHLITKSEGRPGTLNALLMATGRLANPNDPYYYKEKLMQKTQGNLKAFIKTINVNNQNISTPLDLLNTLLVNATKNHYSANDVFRAFFAIPYYTNDASVLMDDLIRISSGQQKDFFKSIDLKRNNIKTVEDLGRYILNLSQRGKINPADILSVIFEASEKNALQRVVEGIKKYSSGNLNNFINGLSLSEKNIVSVQDLVTYLSVHSIEGGYTREYLTKVLSLVASENLSKEIVVMKEVQERALARSLIITIEVMLALLVLFYFLKQVKNKSNNA